MCDSAGSASCACRARGGRRTAAIVEQPGCQRRDAGGQNRDRAARCHPGPCDRGPAAFRRRARTSRRTARIRQALRQRSARRGRCCRAADRGRRNMRKRQRDGRFVIDDRRHDRRNRRLHERGGRRRRIFRQGAWTAMCRVGRRSPPPVQGRPEPAVGACARSTVRSPRRLAPRSESSVRRRRAAPGGGADGRRSAARPRSPGAERGRGPRRQCEGARLCAAPTKGARARPGWRLPRPQSRRPAHRSRQKFQSGTCP